MLKSGVELLTRYHGSALVKFQPKRRRLFLALMVVACFLIVGFLMGLGLTQHQTPPAPAPIIVMNKPYVIPAPKVSLLDRVMPGGRSWGWLWKLRYTLLGKTRTIDLKSEFIDVTDLDPSAVVPRDQPDLTSEDVLQVWRVKETEIKALRQLPKEKPEKIVASPRVTTGNKSPCSIYCGNSVLINGSVQQVGVSAVLLPLIGKDTVDLTAVFCCTEPITNLAGTVSVRTNLDFGGRFQLSQDMAGVFVLATPTRSIEQKRIALLLTSNVVRTKR
jgi:hypothetical protein